MTQYRHFMSLGGTGMLDAATRALCSRAASQSLISRNAFAYVATLPHTSAVAVTADWTQNGQLEAAAAKAIDQHGYPDLCVLWIHSSGARARLALLEKLSHSPCLVIEVLGSGASDPRLVAQHHRLGMKAMTMIEYRFVGLGSLATSTGRRWLTHDEICDGVLECERTGRNVLVGDVSRRASQGSSN